MNGTLVWAPEGRLPPAGETLNHVEVLLTPQFKVPAEAFVKVTPTEPGKNGPPDGPVRRNVCGEITSGSLTFNVKKRE